MPRRRENKLVQKLQSTRPGADRLIVSIDYGTTTTGVAWTYLKAGKNDTVHVVKAWPDSSPSAVKFPSLVQYASENPGTPQNLFGASVYSDALVYAYIKMRLDGTIGFHTLDRLDFRLGDSSSTVSLREAGPKDSIVVATDFLAWVYKTLFEIFSRSELGDVIDCIPIDFYFTTTVIWNEWVLKRLVKAIHQAGYGSRNGQLDTVWLTSEPEAAATACLDEHASKFNVGDTIIILDCGGGTIDMITYRVIALEPKLRLDQILTLGGRFGSMFIDVGFHEWMTEMFPSFADFPLSDKGHGSILMKQFNDAKEQFGNRQRDFIFYLLFPMPQEPASEVYDAKRSRVIITQETMKKLFDEYAVDKIIDMLEAEAGEIYKKRNLDTKFEDIQTLYLAGRFGQSKNLYSRISEWARARRKPKIHRVFQITDSQSAIMRGAVLHGIRAVDIEKSCCLGHYGIVLQQQPPHTNEGDEINWIVERGHPMNQTIRQILPVSLPTECPDHLCMEIKVSRNVYPGEKVGDPDVQSIGSFALDISSIKPSAKPTKHTSSDDFEFEASIEVTAGSEEGVLVFTIEYNRVVLGQVEIRQEYD